MFTGLVQDVGSVVAREARGPSARLSIRTKLGPFALGESIAIDGACLTVIAARGDVFDFDASAETLHLTTLGALAIGARVNLERALAAGDRLGGHLVSGHVDGVGALASREPVGDAVKMAFEAPADIRRYVAKKGSVTVSGVSLTVNEVTGAGFEVMIIPHTLRETTLGELAPRARVNLEVDLIARYVERLLQPLREGKRTSP